MPRSPQLLLHSGWQGINIGDIAHSPGCLRVLQRRYPQATLWYWPRTPDEPAERMIAAAFPDVRIVRGQIDDLGQPTTPELREAFETVDLFVHGSSGGLSGYAGANAFRRLTGKPFGYLGVGAQVVTPENRHCYDEARFVYTRETRSAGNLHAAGVTGPEVRFVPDGTFACDLRDDAAAQAYRDANALKTKGYICVIPRLRYTPYHTIRKVAWSAEKIAEVEAVNARYQEQDHAKLREAIIRWVRETGLRVLLCAEMTYETELIDPLLYEPLPDDVKPHVVRRLSYWLTDEAASIYRDACAVISIECHSPILALQAGTPAFYVRQPQDTIKGQMYYDLGLRDWVFEIDEIDGRAIADRLMQVHADPAAAEGKRAAAMAQADALYAGIDMGV